MPDIVVLPENEKGHDKVIGDVHGGLTAFKQWIKTLRPGDRGFCVGDLVDRGEKGGSVGVIEAIIDNNADPNHNADGSGVAKNARVRVELPSSLAQSQLVKGFVSADNAQPQIIQDDLTLTSMAPMNLEYETGSARLKTNFQDRAIGDEVVSTGVLVGDAGSA